MDNLELTLKELKELGCMAIKISFEDEGALLNEMITMRKLTASIGIELSVKIGGCEAKRDIVDCLYLDCDTIVAPMIETQFSLQKFLKSIEGYSFFKKKGFNLETIQGYNNLSSISEEFKNIDFVTFGRVDFVSSLYKDRSYVDCEEIFNIVSNVFTEGKKNGIKCYLGGAISINSKNFIKKLIDKKLLDKFETRYIIYDVELIDINNFEKLINLGNKFEVEWLKFINNRYMHNANKDLKRIRMIEERMDNK